MNFAVICASGAINSPLESLLFLKRFQCQCTTFHSFLKTGCTTTEDHLRLLSKFRERGVYELENNFLAIHPRRTIQGSFKSFYDTDATPRLCPSPFAAVITGRKLIKANEECEVQLQETRASRSRADHVGENSALRMPQSRPRTYRRGNPRRVFVYTQTVWSVNEKPAEASRR